MAAPKELAAWDGKVREIGSTSSSVGICVPSISEIDRAFRVVIYPEGLPKAPQTMIDAGGVVFNFKAMDLDQRTIVAGLVQRFARELRRGNSNVTFEVDTEGQLPEEMVGSLLNGGDDILERLGAPERISDRRLCVVRV